MKHNRYQRNRHIRQRKKRFWHGMQMLFLVAFFLVITLIIFKLCNVHLRSIEENAAERAMEDIMSEQMAATEASNMDEPPEMFPGAQELLAQNDDFVGMVSFGDMTLYVCQAEDNYYYASHRFDGSEDKAGMIFMDCRASIWPASDNIVLYGHHMKDGSRFGKLNRYTDVDYLLEHPTFKFVSLYEMSSYTPFAIFYTTVDRTSKDYYEFARIDFTDESDFDQYVNDVMQRSMYFIPFDVQYGDQLLTLVTCDDAYDRGRLVIVCKKIQG